MVGGGIAERIGACHFCLLHIDLEIPWEQIPRERL